MQELDRSKAVFATTRSTLLDALRAGDECARRAALDALVRLYWPPVYAFVRRTGHGRELAAELTQAFFADIVFGRGLLARASHERGRLRSLFLTALKRFMVDVHRREHAGLGPLLPGSAIEREEAGCAGLGNGTPEDAFERRWALAIINEAVERCRVYFIGRDKPAHWAAFEARSLRPACAGVQPIPLADLAAQLGFASAADAAAAVQVVRKRLAVILREVLAESDADAGGEAEYQRLREIVG